MSRFSMCRSWRAKYDVPLLDVPMVDVPQFDVPLLEVPKLVCEV
jgi:hypothetical protein